MIETLGIIAILGGTFAGGYCLCMALAWKAIKRAHAKTDEWRQTALDADKLAKRLRRERDHWREMAMRRIEGELVGEPWEEESPEVAAAEPVVEFQHCCGQVHEIDAMEAELPKGAKPVAAFSFTHQEYMTGLGIGANRER